MITCGQLGRSCEWRLLWTEKVWGTLPGIEKVFVVSSLVCVSVCGASMGNDEENRSSKMELPPSKRGIFPSFWTVNKFLTLDCFRVFDRSVISNWSLFREIESSDWLATYRKEKFKSRKDKMKIWLMKSEPDVYSWDDLEKEGQAEWDGVRNVFSPHLWFDLELLTPIQGVTGFHDLEQKVKIPFHLSGFRNRAVF